MIMKFLNSRRVAVCVLAAVIVIFTALGGALSLRRACRNVEELFYDGVGNAGSIDSYLDDALRGALGLVTTAEDYPSLAGDTAELRAAREAMLGSRDGDIVNIAVDNRVLVKAFSALKAGLLAEQLPEQAAEDVEYYSGLFEGAEGAIAHSGYNEAVEEFIEGPYSRFPASLLGSLFGIDPPDYFD